VPSPKDRRPETGGFLAYSSGINIGFSPEPFNALQSTLERGGQ